MVLGLCLCFSSLAWADSLDEGMNAYRAKAFNKAYDLLKPSAIAGDARAQFYVGQIYHEGKGAPQNYKKAALWYRKAADQGLPAAQNNLGFLYVNGFGVTKSFDIAYKWLNLAAAAGHEDAIRGVQNLSAKMTTQQLAETEAKLGWMYHRGWSVEKSAKEAVLWYRSAALRGHPTAQNNLGQLYAKGEGVAQNYSEAEKWYLIAAEQGHARAQYNLAMLYVNGNQGVDQDYVVAEAWLYFASQAGFGEAKKEIVLLKRQMSTEQITMAANRIGVFYQQGIGVTKNNEKAVSWYEKAARSNYAAAQFNLGLLYQKGMGVMHDESQAVAWYSKAAKQGHALAQNNLGVLLQKGVRGQQERRLFIGMKNQPTKVLLEHKVI